MAKKHDEVRAMTDVELRFKASELMGITDGAIPDYPNDIVAALELVEKASARFRFRLSLDRDSWNAEFGEFDMYDFYDVTPSGHKPLASRAITRAFILAMDGS